MIALCKLIRFWIKVLMNSERFIFLQCNKTLKHFRDRQNNFNFRTSECIMHCFSISKQILFFINERFQQCKLNIDYTYLEFRNYTWQTFNSKIQYICEYYSDIATMNLLPIIFLRKLKDKREGIVINSCHKLLKDL